MSPFLNSHQTPTDVDGLLQASHILIHHVLWEQLKLNFAVANWIMMAAIFAMYGNSGNAMAISGT